MVHVSAKLHAVAPFIPGEVVGVLVALLHAIDKRERLASEEGKARDINGNVSASRSLREVVEQTAACVLEAELVHDVRSQQPGVLGRPGDIAIGLLRGAGECILSKVLVLRVDLNAIHGAGADVGAQHQILRATQLVIEAQAPKASSLKDRVVSYLQSQTMKRRGKWRATAGERTLARQSDSGSHGGGAAIFDCVSVSDDMELLNLIMLDGGADPVHRVIHRVHTIHVHHVAAGELAAEVNA